MNAGAGDVRDDREGRKEYWRSGDSSGRSGWELGNKSGMSGGLHKEVAGGIAWKERRSGRKSVGFRKRGYQGELCEAGRGRGYQM